MINLRLATLEDASRIQEIAEITWPISYAGVITSEQIRYMLDLMYSQSKITAAIKDPKQAFWLAKKDGETIGFCSIEFQNPSSEYLRIHKLYVLPTAQGFGIGKLLVDKVAQEAQLKNIHCLHLNVNKRNKAYHFYLKIGFQILQEEVIDIGNGFVMDDYILIKNLD
jgi:diamine N-acetyltransferase